MKKNYYIAKININANIFNIDKFDKIKNELIPKLFLNFQHSTNTYNDGNCEWTITNVEKNEDVISGVLDKTCDENGYKVVETKTKSKINENTQISEFFYFINEEYLVFNSNRNIGYQKFLKVILKVLKKGHQNNSLYLEIGDLEINLLTERTQFEEKLKKCKVLSFKLKYVAPNDLKTAGNILSDFWDIYSKRGIFEADNEDGIRVTKNDGTYQPIIDDSLECSHRGWGEIEAKIKNGDSNTESIKTIKTSEYPVMTKIDDDNNLLSKIKNFVKKAFNERQNKK